MKNYFSTLKETIFNALESGEKASLSFRAEQSDFARLNHAQVRQIGTVQQAHATLKLMRDQQQMTHVFVCGTDPKADGQTIVQQLPQMREAFEVLPPDPYCIQYEGDQVQIVEEEKAIMPMSDVIDSICKTAQGLDLVGFYAAGPQWVGYANSQGAFKWFGRSSMVFDYSLYAQGDKAVKTSIAGSQWQDSQWQQSLASQQVQLDTMRRPAKRLAPGNYRVYLGPAAMAEILSFMLGWVFKASKRREAFGITIFV